MYRTIYMYHSNNYNLYFKISLCKLDIYTKKAAKPITKIIINHCKDINSEKKLKNCRRVLSDVRAYNYLRWRSVRLLFSYLARKKKHWHKVFCSFGKSGLSSNKQRFLNCFPLHIYALTSTKRHFYKGAKTESHLYTPWPLLRI